MFNFEEYEHKCKHLVTMIHELAVATSDLEMLSRQYIGGKLVAKELNETAMNLYVMEDHFKNEVFELGEEEGY